MAKHDWAELKIYEHNLRVTGNEKVIAWLQMALQDYTHASRTEPPKGGVRISPLRGNGPTSDYPNANGALGFLKQIYEWPAVSVFFIDRKRNRFIFPFQGEAIFIPLDRPLIGPMFIYKQLKRVMRALNVSEEAIETVFSRRESVSDNGHDVQDQVVSLENLGIDSRTLKSLGKADIETLQDLQVFVGENGRDDLINLDGIGEKSHQQLLSVLEEHGTAA
jgi:hypothetical protein